MARRFHFVFVDAVDTVFRVRGSVGAIYAAFAARHAIAVDAGTIDKAFPIALSSAPPPAFPDTPHAALGDRERDWWRAVVARTLAPFDRAPAFDAFFTDVFEHFRTAAPWELLDGARDTLVQLRAEGRRLGIVSDMDTRLHDVLADFELTSLFECVVLASVAQASKSTGALFASALAAAGTTAAETVHVGDNIRTDVDGARAAGITPILLATHVQAPADTAHISTWRQLPQRLRELES